MIHFARKKKFLLPVSLSVLAFLILTAVTFARAPSIAENKARQTLEILGFESSLLSSPARKWSHLVFSNVTLDKDGITTIGTLDVKYNPFSIPFSGRLESFSIDRLDVVGEWENAPASLVNFTAWKIPDDISSVSKIPANNIRFQNARISVLTSALGGLSLSFDLEASFVSGKLEFQSRLKSAQKFISFTASADGVISDSFANADIEIDQGKFEIPGASLRAARINGQINLSREKDAGSKIIGELQAGGLTTLNLPWQNASATIDIKDGTVKIYSEAKSTGVDGIEIGINAEKEVARPLSVTGSLHAESGKNLNNYLGQQSTLKIPKNEATLIEKSKDLKIDYIFETAPERKIKYKLGGQEKEITLKK